MANASQEAAPLDRTPFIDSLEEHWNAGYQVLHIHTSEEFRVEQEIAALAADLGVGVICWDCAEGLTMNRKPLPGFEDAKYRKATHALDAIIAQKPNSNVELPKVEGKHGDYFIIFRDLDDYWVDPEVRRRIRSHVEQNRLSNSTFKRPIIVISPHGELHSKLKTEVTVLPFNLPDEKRLLKQIDTLYSYILNQSPDAQDIVLDPSLRQKIAMNLLGLTSKEADDCLSRCIVKHAGFTEDMIDTIKDEKAGIIRKSEVLTYIPSHTVHKRDEIGGFGQYTKWLDERKSAYTPEARALSIDPPRGVIMLGIPGTGKSVIGKATCQILGLPGYILDVGALFGSLVGQSEQRTTEALRTIDAQNGCVLLVDEADKMFGGVTNGSGDSGVARRVFGKILTWLADNRSRAFVVFTLNSVEHLPPELLRAGRFDAIWYTDLPTASERIQIMKIHYRMRQTDPEQLDLDNNDWAAISDKMEGYVGAEIEEVVRNSRYKSFENRKVGTPTFEEIIESIDAVNPQSKRSQNDLNAVRALCKDIGRPVSENTVLTDAKPAKVRERGIKVPNKISQQS